MTYVLLFFFDGTARRIFLTACNFWNILTVLVVPPGNSSLKLAALAWLLSARWRFELDASIVRTNEKNYHSPQYVRSKECTNQDVNITQWCAISLVVNTRLAQRLHFPRETLSWQNGNRCEGIGHVQSWNAGHLLIIIRRRWDFSEKLWWLCTLLHLASETMADKIDRLKIKIMPDCVVQIVRDW